MDTDQQENLLGRFCQLGILTAEVPNAIHDYFQSCQTCGFREVRYPSGPDHYLRIVYDKYGQPKAIYAEPSFDKDHLAPLLEHAKANFASDGTTAIGRHIIFTSHRVQGFWRYKDRIQILPLPIDAPRPQYAVGIHPSLLEFRYSKVKDFTADGIRCHNEGLRLVLVLNALVADSVGWNSPRMPYPSHVWVLDSKDGNIQSRHLQHGYCCPNLPDDKATFSNVDGLEPIQTDEPSSYYLNTVATASPLRLPADLAQLFEQFFSLTPEKQDKFLRACYWLSTTNDIQSWSLKLIAAVQAVEMLVQNAPGQNNVCERCKRSQGPGRTQLFRDFIDRFAPLSEGEDDNRTLLYQTRSDLTHGFKPPFRIDWGFDWAMNPQMNDQSMLLETAMQTVKIALRNWLADNQLPVKVCTKKPRVMFGVMAKSGQNVTLDADGKINISAQAQQ